MYSSVSGIQMDGCFIYHVNTHPALTSQRYSWQKTWVSAFPYCTVYANVDSTCLYVTPQASFLIGPGHGAFSTVNTLVSPTTPSSPDPPLSTLVGLSCPILLLLWMVYLYISCSLRCPFFHFRKMRHLDFFENFSSPSIFIMMGMNEKPEHLGYPKKLGNSLDRKFKTRIVLERLRPVFVASAAVSTSSKWWRRKTFLEVINRCFHWV